MNEPSKGTEKQNDRQPRWKFRKQRKREIRREWRQRVASARDEKSRAQEEKDWNAHSLYLQQKRQWEDREKRYTLINLAKKRAAEAEQAAKEAAKKEWQEALLRIPMITPNRRDNYQYGPKFVGPSTSQERPNESKATHWP